MRSISLKQSYWTINFFTKKMILFLLLVFSSAFIMSQTNEAKLKAENYLKAKGEVYFTFTVDSPDMIEKITRIISISNVKGKKVYAYANKKGFEKFLTYSIDYEVLKHPGEKDSKDVKVGVTKGIWDFDTYPTYTEYISMMDSFETKYSNICKLEDIGNTVLGRDLLFAKISDNINSNEAEPRFMYTASMHGDETIGYILMLRLINYLLTNYGVDPEITDLIDNTEIWICPLENPDGAYYGDNETLSDPNRYNANNIDLNRNYPNPTLGDAPLETPIQPETQAMMDLMDSFHFVLSANIHAGMELLNYPWDSWKSFERKHADHNWFENISRNYADTVHANGIIGYFDDMDNGVTHGADWYYAFGTRQDYITYYKQGREITFELCVDKYAISIADLPLYWSYNYPSFINYIKEANYGIQGLIKDSITNEPIAAKVTVPNHDKDNSFIYSELPHGDYYRPIESGTYSLQFEADGYHTKIVSGVAAIESQVTIQDVLLVPEIISVINKSTNATIQILPNPSNGLFIVRSYEEPIMSYVLFDTKGNLILKNKVNSVDFEINIKNNPKGVYFLKLVMKQNTIFRKLVVI